jgi:hypothetical protein
MNIAGLRLHDLPRRRRGVIAEEQPIHQQFWASFPSANFQSPSVVGRVRCRDRGASASQFFQTYIPHRRIDDARTLCGPRSIRTGERIVSLIF